MNIQSVIPLALACLVLAGCTTEPVKTRITCSPPHGRIWVDGKFVGTTPLLVEMATNQTYLVRAEKAGYLPAETNSVAAWHSGSCAAPLAAGLALSFIPIVGPGMGGAVTTAKIKFYGHAPIDFVLSPLPDTNQVSH